MLPGACSLLLSPVSSVGLLGIQSRRQVRKAEAVTDDFNPTEWHTIGQWIAKLIYPPEGSGRYLQWLRDLHPVERLVSIGCQSSEPFCLKWILDADEVRVIEKEQEFVSKREDEWAHLQRVCPSIAQQRPIDFKVADITDAAEEELPSNHFDFAFCKDVLYWIYLDDWPFAADRRSIAPECIGEQHLKEAEQRVQKAIGQMARAVKPGGWVIAVERIRLEQDGDSIPIGELFKRAGLRQEQLNNAPRETYSYRKAEGLRASPGTCPKGYEYVTVEKAAEILNDLRSRDH